jgi:hypothetical protein
MSGDDDQSGDYGYDLAHEVKAHLATPPSGHPAVPSTPIGAPRTIDPDADFGYDEAHEF